MKTPIAALAFAAAALCAGSALAQTRPQTPAPRTGVAAPPPAVGTVPAGQGQGQRRGIGVSDGSNRDHIDQDAQLEIPGTAGFPTNLGATPTNGVGGTGGGRYTFRPRVINNSETETGLAVGTVPAGQGQGQAPQAGIGAEYDLGGATLAGTRSSSTGPAGDQPVPAEAPINTSRSNIKKPSSLAVAPEAGASPAPAPVAPR